MISGDGFLIIYKKKNANSLTSMYMEILTENNLTTLLKKIFLIYYILWSFNKLNNDDPHIGIGNSIKSITHPLILSSVPSHHLNKTSSITLGATTSIIRVLDPRRSDDPIVMFRYTGEHIRLGVLAALGGDTYEAAFEHRRSAAIAEAQIHVFHARAEHLGRDYGDVLATLVVRDHRCCGYLEEYAVDAVLKTNENWLGFFGLDGVYGRWKGKAKVDVIPIAYHDYIVSDYILTQVTSIFRLISVKVWKYAAVFDYFIIW